MLQLAPATLPKTKNCLGCAHYLKCKDPLKSVIFLCSQFKETKNSKVDGIERLFNFIDMDSSSYLPDSIDELEGPAISDPGSREQAFNIAAVIDDIVKSDTVVSSDIKINDRDFAQAPNFYTFCVSDKYINQKPYIEQAILGTRILAEYCPDCTDMEWFEHTHRVDDSLGVFEQKVALLDKGVCPHCKKGRAWFVKKGKLNFYYEAALSAGQRSGKSAWLGMMSAYLTHLQIKLQKPNEVYGLMRSNVLHGTFAALTYAQAKDTLWEPFYGHLTDSPWFSSYHRMLDDAQNKYGEELYKLKDTFVMYRHRRLLVYPAGPDKRTLRGRTRFFASIDELGWFPNDVSALKNVKMNANEVYIALERSLLTVRASAEKLIQQGFDMIPSGYFLNISSPSSVRDKIMELVRSSQGSRKIYGVIKPTWEMNPNVSREALEEEFRKDPVAAMRDYGAQPPLSANPLIPAASYVEAIFSDKKNPLRIQHAQKKSKDGHVTRYAKIEKIKQSGKASVLAMDAGYSNNSFSCAIGHLKDKKFPVISLLVEVMPLPGIPLNYRKIYDEIILPIIDQRNVKLMAADRWNSLKILADAEEDAGVLIKQYSLKYPDMQNFKSYIMDGQLSIPKPEWEMVNIVEYDQSKYPEVFKGHPAEHFALQLLTVQDTGASVIKGDQLTDDLVRAAMLAVTMLLHPDYQDVFNAADEAIVSRIDISQAAVYKGASGGGSGQRNGGTMSPDSVSPGAMGVQKRRT